MQTETAGDELRHFHGSEQIYFTNQIFRNYCYTEGMRYLQPWNAALSYPVLPKKGHKL